MPARRRNFKWMDVTSPYVKSTQLYNCPSDTFTTTGTSTGTYVYPPDTRSQNENRGGSYNLNGGYMSGVGGGSTIPAHSLDGQALAAVEDSARTVYCADGINTGKNQWVYWWHNGFDQPVYTTTTTPKTFAKGANAGTIGDRHLETVNTLFCDGHVKAMKLDELTRRNPTKGKVYYYFTIEDDTP